MRAHLVQLLDHVEGGGLGVTVDHCDLSRLHLSDLIPDHEVLAASLWSNDHEGVAPLEPRLDHGDVSLDTDGLHDWW